MLAMVFGLGMREVFVIVIVTAVVVFLYTRSRKK